MKMGIVMSETKAAGPQETAGVVQILAAGSAESEEVIMSPAIKLFAA